MSRHCAKTGRKTAFGNTRSHSLRHTRRTWLPNMQKKRVFDPATGAYKTMKVSAAYLRTLAKSLQEGKKRVKRQRATSPRSAISSSFEILSGQPNG